MYITSRKKIMIGHRPTLNRDASLIVIAVEGQKTEKIYFESICFKNSRVKIKVLPSEDNNSAPNHVLSRIKKYCNCLDLKEEKDQFWLVVDKDRWKDWKLAHIYSEIRKMKNSDWQMAISNPCFEVWLYLHVSELNESVKNGKTAKTMLRNIIGVYNEKNLDMDSFCSGVDKAIERAEKLDVNQDSPWPLNPGSRVYLLIKEINNL